MLGTIIDSLMAVVMYVVAFYRHAFDQFALPSFLVTFNYDAAIEASSVVADAMGHSDTANGLKIALDNMRTHDNMKSLASVIEILLSPKMTREQYNLLKTADQKLDAILQIGNAFPDAANAVKSQFNKALQGTLTIDDIDNLIHAAIFGYEHHRN